VTVARAPGEARGGAAGGLTRDHARWVAFQMLLHSGQWAARPTARWRSVPDFYVMGGQRCGTTSIYRYLRVHPQVRFPRLTKGTHWYDEEGHRPEAWFRANFPLEVVRARSAARGAVLRVGEACPYYLFHPSIPGWIREMSPDARLVVVLRDPVARAWSQYRHEFGRGFETLSLEAALDAEPERLAGAEQLLAGRGVRHRSHQHHSYVARGRYAEQIQRLWAAFPHEQTLILYTVDLDTDPERTMRRLTDFLGVAPTPVADTSVRWNRRPTEGALGDPIVRRIRAAMESSDDWLTANLEEPPPWRS
jgi:Sulfotransferase family